MAGPSTELPYGVLGATNRQREEFAVVLPVRWRSTAEQWSLLNKISIIFIVGQFPVTLPAPDRHLQPMVETPRPSRIVPLLHLLSVGMESIYHVP